MSERGRGGEREKNVTDASDAERGRGKSLSSPSLVLLFSLFRRQARLTSFSAADEATEPEGAEGGAMLAGKEGPLEQDGRREWGKKTRVEKNEFFPFTLSLFSFSDRRREQKARLPSLSLFFSPTSSRHVSAAHRDDRVGHSGGGGPLRGGSGGGEGEDKERAIRRWQPFSSMPLVVVVVVDLDLHPASLCARRLLDLCVREPNT